MWKDRVGYHNPTRVGVCHVQTSETRWNKDPANYLLQDQDACERAREYTPAVDFEEESSPPNHSDQCFRPGLPPQRWGPSSSPQPVNLPLYRLNLTALSQRFNLYFVAARENIFVHRPRDGLRNHICLGADYVLRPPIIGPIVTEREASHTVNNMVLGELGPEEVLAMVFDDGNVAVYNVSKIAAYLAMLSQPQDEERYSTRLDVASCKPRPFLLASVLESAWGLSLHKESKLIAVTCNGHTISVFFPALTDGDAAVNEEAAFEQGPVLIHRGFRIDTGSQLVYPASRKENFCVTFHCMPEPSNLPSVSFASDERGRAVQAVAVDLCGHVYICQLDPVRPGIERMSNDEVVAVESQYKRGWALSVIPGWAFMATDSWEDAVGRLRRQQGSHDQKFPGDYIGAVTDITATIVDVADNILRPEATGMLADEAKNVLLACLEVYADYESLALPRLRLSIVPPSSADDDAVNPHVPSLLVLGTQRLLLSYLRDGSPGPAVRMSAALLPNWMTTFLHLNSGLEGRPTEWIDGDRLPFLVFVPELCLVVVGSAWGFVALVTLTRAGDAHRAFRVEKILPSASTIVGTEALSFLHPSKSRKKCQLSGVAVSPVWQPRAARLPRRVVGGAYQWPRFRLLMHYRNNTILSYELSRMSSGALSCGVDSFA